MENNNTQNFNEQDINNQQINTKDYNKTLITAIFLSPLGIHRFIHKKYITGTLQLILTFILFIGVVWSIVDVFIILAGKFRDEHGNKIKSDSPFLSNPWNYVAIIRQIFVIFFVILIPIILFVLVVLFIAIMIGLYNNNTDLSEEYEQCTKALSMNVCEEIFENFDDSINNNTGVNRDYNTNGNQDNNNNNNNNDNNDNNNNNNNTNTSENYNDYQEDINDRETDDIANFESSRFYGSNNYVDQTYQTLKDQGFTYYDTELTDTDLVSERYEDSFIEFVKYDETSKIYVHVYVPYNVSNPSDDLLVVEYELENRDDVLSDVNSDYIDYNNDERDEQAISSTELQNNTTQAEYDYITGLNSVLF